MFRCIGSRNATRQTLPTSAKLTCVSVYTYVSVKNRRNVQVGSRDNQQKPHPGKDGFLFHTRLGLVGWITYWCYGDAALAVVILVALINTLGLTELVRDALGSHKQKEAETNVKIVDLLKNALDETKNCRNEQQRHYAKRPFSCWFHRCSRVRG
jgi:hypothetical protein